MYDAMIHIDKFHLYFKLSSKDKAEVFSLQLVSKELAAILQHYVRELIFMKQIFFSLLIFKKKMQILWHS